MTDKEKASHWIDGAEANFNAAKTLLGGGHYLECGFFCHLTIEKALKAAIANKGETPLPVHNLLRLAELGGVYQYLT